MIASFQFLTGQNTGVWFYLQLTSEHDFLHTLILITIFFDLGVQHGWDLFYVFGLPTIGHPNFSYIPRDADLSKTTMRIITDFFKEGYVCLIFKQAQDITVHIPFGSVPCKTKR